MVSSSIYPDTWPKKRRLHIGKGAQAWWIHFMSFEVVWVSQPLICDRYLLMAYVTGTHLQAHNVIIHHHLQLIWKCFENSNFRALISWHSSFNLWCNMKYLSATTIPKPRRIPEEVGHYHMCTLRNFIYSKNFTNSAYFVLGMVRYSCCSYQR